MVERDERATAERGERDGAVAGACQVIGQDAQARRNHPLTEQGGLRRRRRGAKLTTRAGHAGRQPNRRQHVHFACAAGAGDIECRTVVHRRPDDGHRAQRAAP